MSKIYSEDEIKTLQEQFKVFNDAENGNMQLDKTMDTILSYLKNQKTGGIEHPIAIVVGGQSGAGKTGIIGYALNSLRNDAIVVDNDTYREFHPRVKEINTVYPDLFTELTDQLSFYATPLVIDELIDGRYNLVIHQTLKNNTIADNAITKLLNAGYIVGVCCLAVHELESNLSMIERSLEQQAIDGTCRWVAPKNHDIAYNGIPSTIEYIENGCGKFNFIEILMRGKESPCVPRVIHKVLNRNNTERQNEVITSLFPSVGTQNYKSAKDALLDGREKSKQEVLEVVDQRLERDIAIDKMISVDNDSEAKRRIKKLREDVEATEKIKWKD